MITAAAISLKQLGVINHSGSVAGQWSCKEAVDYKQPSKAGLVVVGGGIALRLCQPDHVVHKEWITISRADITASQQLP